MLCRIVVQVKVLNIFNGYLKPLNRLQLNCTLQKLIHVSKCSMEKAVFVDVQGEESDEAITGCSGY